MQLPTKFRHFFALYSTNRQKFGDGRQLRRAKSVLQTMFLDSDLKELAEGGVPIEEVNAMQKQRDEYNKNTFTRV